jgi:cell division septum initiation protein DivIVA
MIENQNLKKRIKTLEQKINEGKDTEHDLKLLQSKHLISEQEKTRVYNSVEKLQREFDKS